LAGQRYPLSGGPNHGGLHRRRRHRIVRQEPVWVTPPTGRVSPSVGTLWFVDGAGAWSVCLEIPCNCGLDTTEAVALYRRVLASSIFHFPFSIAPSRLALIKQPSIFSADATFQKRVAQDMPKSSGVWRSQKVGLQLYNPAKRSKGQASPWLRTICVGPAKIVQMASTIHHRCTGRGTYRTLP